MGKIADIVNAPGFSEKSALEKAQARRDLFALTLEEHPEIKQAFDGADDAGKQTLADQFKAKLQADFPDAFTTRGFKIEISSDGKRSVTEARTPVYDIGTEQILSRTAPIAARGEGGYDKWQEDAAKLATLPEDQRHAMAPFIYERYGDSDMLAEPGKPLFGKPEDFLKREESGAEKALKFAIPAITRLSLPLMASVTKKPGIVAAAGAVGDAGAQVMEKMMGTRATFSPVEMGLSSLLSVAPAAAVAKFSNPALNLAARVGVRSAEGAAQGAISEGVRQLVDDDKADLGKLGMAAGFGVGVGALIGAFEPKIAALLAGKTREDAVETLKKAAATAAPEERAALSAAQAQIEKTLGIGSEFTSASDTLLARSKTAAESAETLIGERDKLAGQFTQAKAEEAALIAKDGVLAGPETTVLGDDPANNAITAIETRPGESAAERARAEAAIAAGAPKVDDGTIPPTTQLSPQAQRVMDEYGFVAPKLMSSLAGGTGGFVYGASTGDTPEDRIKRGAAFAVVGAAGGYIAGRSFTAATMPKVTPGQYPEIEKWYKHLAPPDAAPLSERLATLPNRIREALVTKFAPLDRIEGEIAKANPGMTAFESALPLSRKFEQVAGAGGKGLQDVRDFERNIVAQIKSEEARDFDVLLATKRTGQRLQANQQLAIEQARIQAIPAADRTADEIATLAKPADLKRVAGQDLNSVDRTLQELETKLGARRFAELDQLAAGSFQQEVDENLRLQVTSGRLSEDAYAAIKASNDFYAPFRVLHSAERFDGSGLAAAVDTRTQIARITRGIDDPDFHLDSPTRVAAEQIFKGRVLAEKNLKMLELAKLADADKSGTVIRKLFDGQEPRNGFEAVNYFDNGAPLRLEVDPAVARAVKGLNPSQTGVIALFAQALGSTFRFGATSANAAFQVRNLVFADQPRLLLMSKYGAQLDPRELYQIPMDFIHALMSSLGANVARKESHLARAFYESGAAGSTLQDAISRVGGGRFEAENVAQAAVNGGRGVVDTVQDFTRVLEETTKMMGFKRGLRIEGIASMSPAAAAAKLEEVVTEVRNFAGSPDFARHGGLAKDMNMLFTFFNARLQGVSGDLTRLAGGDGAKVARDAWIRLGATAGAASIYFWYRNQAPENKADFEKLSQRDREGFLWVPRYDDKGAPLYGIDAQGKKFREYHTVPKRESAKTISNLTNAALDFAASNEPDAAARFGVNFIEDISPINITGRNGTERAESAIGNLNPILRVPYEVVANRDTFRHAPIVPANRQGGSDPTQQYFPGRTPDLYVTAAKMMPQTLWNPLRSPLMLQQTVQGLTGGLVTQFTRREDVGVQRDPATAALAANPLTRMFVGSPRRGNEDAENIAREVKAKAADARIALDNSAVTELEKIQAMPIPYRRAYAEKIAADKPELLTAVLDEMERRQKGFDTADRIAAGLGVRDGARAEYLRARINKLPVNERRAFAKDQFAKRILTDEVWEQILAPLAAKQ